VGAVDAAALGPFGKRAHGHVQTRKRESGCDFAGRYNFQKIIKIVATGFRLGLCPGPPSWILGGLLLRGKMGRAPKKRGKGA